MKFGIDMGHNCPPDTGAVGIKVEDNLTKAVGTKLIAKLAAAGHSVIICTPNSATSVNDSLAKRVNKANNNNVGIFVSIHFNAFQDTAKPMGSEVYAISNASRNIARGVLDEIVNLGFIDRGIKGTKYYVIANTSMPAILIECCFIDSKADMNLFDAEKMAEAIKVGLIGEGEDTSVAQPGILKITQKTILKPSTKQASEILQSELVDIAVGEYPVLDSRFEENHYWVKWPDQSKANRDQHFVFAGHGKVIANP